MMQGPPPCPPLRRLVTTLLLSGALALPAAAMDWPWQDRGDIHYSYCKGFVVAALGALPVQDLSRTQLWLAWNTINREGIPPTTVPDADYQQGYDQFHQWLSGDGLDQVRDTADDDCALGRN